MRVLIIEDEIKIVERALEFKFNSTGSSLIENLKGLDTLKRMNKFQLEAFCRTSLV